MAQKQIKLTCASALIRQPFKYEGFGNEAMFEPLLITTAQKPLKNAGLPSPTKYELVGIATHEHIHERERAIAGRHVYH
jgi:hypothetical protein